METTIAQLADPATLLQLALPYLVQVAGAIFIFFIGRLLARLLVAALRRSMTRAQADETIVEFVGTVANVVLMVFVVIAAMSQLGVKTTAAAAIVGGGALAVGLSLQGQLSALAAGVMLILFKPFRRGDFVEAAGQFGTVEAVRIVNTLLVTTNNQEVTIPNNQVWASPITNYSARDTRRMDLTVSISLDGDVDRAKTVLQEIVDTDARVLADPPPAIRVNAITESSVDILFRPWLQRPEFWDAYWDTVEAIKKRFDAEGIPFAHQRRFVHMTAPDRDTA